MKSGNKRLKTHSEIKKSIKSLSQDMVSKPVSVGEGEEYYQLDALRAGAYMNEDLEHIKSCMQKMMTILTSLNHFSDLSEQRFNYFQKELDEIKLKVARLEGHDNMFH